MNKRFSQRSLTKFANHKISFSNLLDTFDPERVAQREEFLKREKKKDTSSEKPKKLAHHTPRPKKSKAKKRKAGDFEDKLKQTNQWLQETFPNLFAPSCPRALDIHIIRDIKALYKSGCEQNKYPNGLAIKAALYHYMKTPEYQELLIEGTPRYNAKGEVTSTV